jgi:putative ubiquitin-RnfH superfamily antitoxin RatB of RatAB toxin-antitoxin module
MRVEVVYAGVSDTFQTQLELAEGATVEQAIRASGVLARFPEIDLAACRVGVFSERCPLDRPLRAGERVEIYRSLIVDPKEARRRRAQGRKQDA